MCKVNRKPLAFELFCSPLTFNYYFCLPRFAFFILTKNKQHEKYSICFYLSFYT